MTPFLMLVQVTTVVWREVTHGTGEQGRVTFVFDAHVLPQVLLVGEGCATLFTFHHFVTLAFFSNMMWKINWSFLTKKFLSAQLALESIFMHRHPFCLPKCKMGSLVDSSLMLVQAICPGEIFSTFLTLFTSLLVDSAFSRYFCNETWGYRCCISLQRLWPQHVQCQCGSAN